MPNTKWPGTAAAVLPRHGKHERDEGWRGPREGALQTLKTKLAKTFALTKTHSQIQRVISSFPLRLSLSYIQRAGPACVTPLCSVCLRFRPAVAALAASGADPPHFNASDIYLGRTTGGTGGGGMTACTTGGCGSFGCGFLSLHPPLASPLHAPVLCFAEEAMCLGCLCHLSRNKTVLRQR